MEQKTRNFLAEGNIGTLMRQYAEYSHILKLLI